MICLLTCAGCDDGTIARYPVKGQVLVDGQPAEGAIVIFCPVEGSEDFKRERPFSRTDAEGRFQLRTFEPLDGAPAGDYQVTVTWSGPPGSGSSGGGDRLRRRYASPDVSGLTAKVVEGDNELPPFELVTQ